MPKLFYFLAPAFTINPESDTAPKLGSMFSSLDILTGPLNQLEPPYIPDNLKNQSASTDFCETVKKGFEGSIGLNANVAQGIAGSADVVYAFAKNKRNAYRCELLETVEFEPTKELVAESIVASLRVQNFFSNALPGRKKLYMITGLKIATGFSASASRETEHGPSLNVGLDAAAFGVPAEAGPEIGLSTLNARSLSQGRSANKIVFAYRVVKIRLRRDGEAKYKYKSGGKYADDDDDSGEEKEPWEIESLDESEVYRDFPDSVAVKIKKSNSTDSVQD